MASIIKTSINLNNIPKDRIFEGKKGKYLPVTITLNDELDQFGNQGPVVVEQVISFTCSTHIFFPTFIKLRLTIKYAYFMRGFINNYE